MAISNLGQFNAELANFSKKLVPEDHARLMRRVTLEVLRRVVLKTPVGNPSLWKSPAPPGYVGGTARNNWQVGRSPVGGFINTPDKTGAAALARGAAFAPSILPFDFVWIYNNAPYIGELENGYSKQAPSGMVAVTLAEVRFIGLIQ